MVRSKSEKIIADLLDELGIPYRYEQEVILEHLGLMDNKEYASRNLRKIAGYVKAGYVQGKTLLISAETRNAPLDIEYLECILKPFARELR